MEDKRTLLAFLLIGIILFGMPYYLEWVGLNPPAPPPQDPAVQEQTPAPSPTSPQPQILEPPATSPSTSNTPAVAEPRPMPNAASSIPLADSVFTPRNIRVETPLAVLVFSTAGGDLISAEIPAYLHKGDPVQLLPEGGRGLALRIKHKDKNFYLDKVEFSPSAERLDIGKNEEATLHFTAQLNNGLSVRKTLTFSGDRYAFGLKLTIDGLAENSETFLTWQKGIALTEKSAEIDLIEMRALAYMNEDLTEIRADGEDERFEDKGALRWVGIRSKYFLTALVPQAEGQQFRIALDGAHLTADPHKLLHYSIGMRSDRRLEWDNLVYIGPLDYEELVHYDVELERAMDLGWPVIREISKVLIIIFVAAHQYIPNYGVVIILFAIVVKLLLYPFTRKTYESTAKMQELQPKISALREKYKNDNQRLSRETMKLYKEEGVNPLGGCLPLLPQMPIFFALYQVFSSTIELRQAHFGLWITDLSLPDEINIAGFGLHVLPLLMAGAMFFQQKMTMKDPKQAFMVYLMPVMMIFFFWNISSGLVLYWTVFNVLTIGQQVLVNRMNQEA